MKLENWQRKLCVWTVILCLVLSSMPAAFAAEGEGETQPEAAVFVIPKDAIYLSDAQDLLELAENCISDAWSRDKVVVLKNDISLTSVDFSGIPTFGGIFLGQGHTISSLKLTGNKDALGFFRYLQKTALVEDLHLKGTVHPAKDDDLDIGGFVGVNSGTIRNCSFTGSVSGSERIGGIAGRNQVTGTIKGCTVSGTVYGDHYIGGIAGENTGVIRSCENNAQINTQVDHNSVTAAMSSLSLETFTARESISDATNIGGIAGTSSGVIRSCENRGDVGYEKMGYNVGGIAGSQIGYITACENHGTIHGSNGVGGIVGQFKPNVVLNFGENLVTTLTDQMAGMMGSMQSLMGSMNGMMGSMSSDMDSMNETMDMLRDPENWNPDSLNAAMNEMSNSFNSMYNNMISMGSGMTSQMQGMMGSMSGMMNTMERMSEGMNLKIIDVSKEDTPENTICKVSSCNNFGLVYGETYTGGIAGIADIEDTTVQEEVQGQFALFSEEAEIVLRLVIRDCRNRGTVSGSKQYAGGIVGYMTTGAVFNGMNTGSIDALNADYAGGIAGSSETYIAGSANRSILAGRQYVGGIAGYGTEVVHCDSVADIAAASKFAGGVLGSTDPLPDAETGLILENRYYLTGKNLGGIDGVAYEGAAVPMTIKEFLDTENLDEIFRTVTIRFVAEDREDTVMTVNLGNTLPLSKIPQLEVGEKEEYHWVLHQSVTAETLGMGEAAPVSYISQERLTGMLFDQTYEAVFDAKNHVIYSENKISSGRPLALAVGAFDQDITLRLTDLAEEAISIDGVPMQEYWQVTLEGPGVEKLHYRIPADVKPETITLYVQDASGNWVQRDFTTEGSYMIFPFAHGEQGFALAVQPPEELPVSSIMLAAGAGFLLLALCLILRKRRKAGKKSV